MPMDESLRNAQSGPALPQSSLPKSNIVLEHLEADFYGTPASEVTYNQHRPFMFHPCFRHSIMNTEAMWQVSFPGYENHSLGATGSLV